MRKLGYVVSTVALVSLVLAACRSEQSGPGTLQFYAGGGDIVRQGLLSKDGWQLIFDHVYVTMTEITAYQTDPPYDPVYSLDIIRYEISTTLDGTYTVDLNEGEDAAVLVGEASGVEPGAYNAMSWKMVPAPSGDAAGYSIVLVGQAAKGGQTVDFTIKLDWEAAFLCGDYFVPGEDLKAQKGRLDSGGTADLEMTFALDSIFGDGTMHSSSVLNRAALGFEPFAALAQGGSLVVDLAGMQKAFSDEENQAFEKALREIGYTGARLCYFVE